MLAPVRQVFPVAADPADLVALYGDIPEGEAPWVRVNMVASVDGATALDGRAGGLGGPADRALFRLLRALSDVVLVGAATVRAESYGPVKLSDDLRDERRRRGRPETPPVAVVTRTCRFDLTSRLFTESRPIVVTVESAPPDLVARTEAVADVVMAGHSNVDPAVALGALAERGLRSVVCEGGPTLNGLLAATGLIDELALTVSPLLVAGVAKPIVFGAVLAAPMALRPVSVCEDDGYVFYRYRPSGDAQGPVPAGR